MNETFTEQKRSLRTVKLLLQTRPTYIPTSISTLVDWHTRNRISNWNSYSLHNLRINEIPIGIVILILKIYLTNRELVSIYKAIWKRFIQLQSSKANCNYLAFQQSLKNRKFSKHFSFLQEAKKFPQILCFCNLL